MDDTVIAKHLENFDHRLAHVEQILQQDIEPRLAHVEQILQRDIEPRLANMEQILPTLVTHEYLDDKLAAQSAELRQEIRDAVEHGVEQSRRHMDIVAESLRSDIQLLAEHAASTSPRKRTE